jgi:hypothetical protein
MSVEPAVPFVLFYLSPHNRMAIDGRMDVRPTRESTGCPSMVSLSDGSSWIDRHFVHNAPSRAR